jgi:phosphoribosylglycinamide formyltransferase-1
MLQVAVLISGRGSNLQALIDACAQADFPAKIVRVIANRADAGGLDRAAKAGIGTAVISHRDYSSRQDFDAALDAEIRASGAELVCLAGFMRILTPWFVERWLDRLINIHPSLLPAFKGLDTHQRALDEGVRITGCTVHFVRPDMDTGPVILQAAVPVLDGDDADMLAARILRQEHVIYPMALKLIAEGRVRVDGPRTVIDTPQDETATLISPCRGL